MRALVAKETKRRKRRWKMAELFADERCSGSILEFLRTTDVGKMVPPPRADAESEASAAEPECPRDGCGDDRSGGRGFREKFIWITTSGFGTGGIQRGLEGRAGVLGTHFLFFFLRLSLFNSLVRSGAASG